MCSSMLVLPPALHKRELATPFVHFLSETKDPITPSTRLLAISKATELKSSFGDRGLNMWVFVNQALSPWSRKFKHLKFSWVPLLLSVWKVEGALSVCKAVVSLECTFCGSVLNHCTFFSCGQRLPANSIFKHSLLLRSATPRASG